MVLVGLEPAISHSMMMNMDLKMKYTIVLNITTQTNK